MSSINLPCLYLITVLVLGYNVRLGSCQHFEIIPNLALDLVTGDVELKCIASNSPDWEQSVTTMDISMEGHHPLAVLQHDKLNYGPAIKSNMKAEGRIHLNNTNESFLTVTIKKPGLEDAGRYQCRIYYVDGFGELVESKDFADLNVTGSTHDTVRYLSVEMAIMKKAVKKTVDMLQKQLADQQKELKDFKEKTEQYIKKDSFNSAFMAGFRGGDPSYRHQVLIFRDVKLNLGDHYDGDTGVYTAPVDGLYTFHVFLEADKEGVYIQVDIQVNDVKTARLEASDEGNDDQSSVTSIVQLKAGDKVKCFVNYSPRSDQVHPFPFTGFSGNLINAF